MKVSIRLILFFINISKKLLNIKSLDIYYNISYIKFCNIYQKHENYLAISKVIAKNYILYRNIFYKNQSLFCLQ